VVTEGEFTKQAKSFTMASYLLGWSGSEKSAKDDAFAWFGWSPEPGLPSYKALHDHFPGALPGPAVKHRVDHLLQQHGMTPDNTLFGTSICPDEINNMRGTLANGLKDYWGAVFPMGGISGVPFSGKTGFAAFSHHVPDDGNILVLFGPHVGISLAGELGKCERKGQSHTSTACGAVVGAYNQCCSKQVGPEFDDPVDVQQAWIRNRLIKDIDSIQTSEHPQAALARLWWEIVKDNVMQVVNTDFGPGNLVLLGGIQINMPFPYHDHFQPRMFEVHRHGHDVQDLMHLIRAPTW